MLNELTEKERDVQYALGLVSWHHVVVRPGSRQPMGFNFKAVSKADALQQFNTYARLYMHCSVLSQILQDIDRGDYKIKLLPWTVSRY